MNTTELNAAQLGSASTLPGIYIRGALAVYAVSVAIFTSTGYQQVYGAALAQVAAKGLFGAIFQVQAKTEATASSSFIVRAVLVFRSATEATARAYAVFGAGSIARFYGSISAFVVSRWTSQVNIAFTAATDAVAITLSKFGTKQTVYGETNPTAFSVEAGFTTFGEYAPESRFIMVQVEDRKAVVV